MTGGDVLVHCFAGRSRSMSLSEALEHVRVKRPIVSPNPGFMLQLGDYHTNLQGIFSNQMGLEVAVEAAVEFLNKVVKPVMVVMELLHVDHLLGVYATTRKKVPAKPIAMTLTNPIIHVLRVLLTMVAALFLIYWNYNYGVAGENLKVDLLNHPEYIEQNATLAFQAAIWGWMTPKKRGQPAAHEVFVGDWKPTKRFAICVIVY